MKVLLIQENGRHEANRNYRECFCLQRGFKSNGVDSDVWGKGHDNYETEPDWESYDLLYRKLGLDARLEQSPNQEVYLGD